MFVQMEKIHSKVIGTLPIPFESMLTTSWELRTAEEFKPFILMAFSRLTFSRLRFLQSLEV